MLTETKKPVASKKHYPPTGTCYWCDAALYLFPERDQLPVPSSRFCSDEHEQAYKRRYPKRYQDMKAS